MNKKTENELKSIKKVIVSTEDKIDKIAKDINLTLNNVIQSIVEVNKLRFKLEDLEQDLKSFIGDYKEEDETN